jgi:hypothetical protein
MLIFMHWLAMASTARPSASRRFAVRLAAPRSRARRNTPLYRLKTPSYQIAMVLTGLAEGLDPSAAERVAGLSSGHYHYLAKPCREARTDLARALLLPSPPPAPAASTNCAPGSAATSKCSGCGWPSTPARSFFPCSNWVPAHNTWHTCSFTLYDRAWPPFCLPLFTSDGLNLYFYAAFGAFWNMARREMPRAERAPVAGGDQPDLRAGEKMLTFGASCFG